MIDVGGAREGADPGIRDANATQGCDQPLVGGDPKESRVWLVAEHAPLCLLSSKAGFVGAPVAAAR